MSLTPLERQLRDALQLMAATAYPYSSAPTGLGLERTPENATVAAVQRRTMHAEQVATEALAAAQAREGINWAADTITYMRCKGAL